AVNKAYKFVFFNDKDPRAEQFREVIERAGILTGQGGIAYMNDQNQIMIMQERGAFSLGTIRELREDLDSKWRSDFHNPTIPSFHARNDIKEWITWTRADEESYDRIRNLFLVGVALKIIEFV